jgi:hypothetical protein
MRRWRAVFIVLVTPFASVLHATAAAPAAVSCPWVGSANGLPTGLAIAADGSITGTPTTAGTVSVDVTARDANGAQATTSFLWSVES